MYNDERQRVGTRKASAFGAIPKAKALDSNLNHAIELANMTLLR